MSEIGMDSGVLDPTGIREKEKSFVPVTSPEQWKAIEERLTGFFAKMAFRVDGQEIAVERRIISEGRSCLLVFIDGHIDARLCLPDEETKLFDKIVEKVWRRRVVHLVSPQRKKMLELKWKAERYSKRDIKAIKKMIGFDRDLLSYVPDYTTARSLVQRFKKIEGIEVKW